MSKQFNFVKKLFKILLDNVKCIGLILTFVQSCLSNVGGECLSDRVFFLPALIDHHLHDEAKVRHFSNFSASFSYYFKTALLILN